MTAVEDSFIDNGSYKEDQSIARQVFVIKRNKSRERFQPEKIRASVQKHGVGLGDVDQQLLMNELDTKLYDGISTKEIDDLLIRLAALKIASEPQYGQLAARLLHTSILKEASLEGSTSFSEGVRLCHAQGLLSDTVNDAVQAHADRLNDEIDHGRTDFLTYFGLFTLYNRYFLRHPTTRKVLETPQGFFMRVAAGLFPEDVESIVSYYKLFSSLRYLPSTPTLFNSGSQRSQLSSCFLLDSPQDSLESIFGRLHEVAQLSKFAGGIGQAYHRIRSEGSLIRGTNGLSNGVVPWLKIQDSSVAAVNQGGRRKGAACIYLATWHADIEAFLELRDSTGDEGRRAHNLNIANWVPDLFMKRVRAGANWSLFDPKTVPELCDLYGDAFEKAYERAERAGLAVKNFPAQVLYARMMRTLAETGNGWMTFSDPSNLKSAQTGEPGQVIHLSNLCVAPETKILTSKGHIEIAELKDQRVDIWNGSEWSSVEVKQTGKDVELLRVVLSNGATIDCTPQHKFAVAVGTGWDFWEAQHLEPGVQLAKFKMPVVWEGQPGDLDLAYRSGLSSEPEVPQGMSVSFRMAWLEGLLDSRGFHAKDGAVRINSVDSKFLHELRLMLTTLGVDSVVGGSHLELDLLDLQMEMGVHPRTFEISAKGPKTTMRAPSVAEVIRTGRISDTYCFTEPKQHLGTFNGVVTGQCTEILEVTSDDQIANCNLGSLNLSEFVTPSGDFDFEALGQTVRLGVRQLDRVIDINFYPLEKARSSNLAWRPIGLGQMGLQDVFFKMGLAFDDPEAAELSTQIAHEIYYYATLESALLAKKLGPCPNWSKTRTAKGKFQFDLWNQRPLDKPRWDALRVLVEEFGQRNSLLIAIAPTATIASIAGCFEAIEPQVSNLFKREVLSGEFLQLNQYLVAELKSLGLWTERIKLRLIEERGSIQKIEEIPEEIRYRYRTVWELSQKVLIDMAAARGPYIDQSQSLNLFVAEPNIGRLSSMYMHTWEKGLKTTYYLRSRPATEIKQVLDRKDSPQTEEKIIACSLANPSACEACQ